MIVAAILLAASAPATITPADLGAQTFTEGWLSPTFDAGPSLTAKDKPLPRWRTWRGSGCPASVYCRQITDQSFASDKTIGIDPFIYRTGTVVLQVLKVPQARRAEPILFGKPYAGSEISTKFTFSQVYGYFEVLLRLPKSKGFYAGAWLMPIAGTWPNNGEIDMMESVGDPKSIYATVHSEKLPAAQGKQIGKKIALGFDGSAGVHSYGARWSPDTIAMYVDRKKVAEYPTPADMKTVPMYPIISLGAGIPWDNAYPDASTVWPIQMPVYSVRAWKLP